MARDSFTNAATPHAEDELTRLLVCVRSCLSSLQSCGITDEDMDDFASCLDTAGRENIVRM